jgi:putative Holliday junction resolvase
MRVVALDPGEARVGVAVSDSEARVATPVGVIRRASPGNGANSEQWAKEVAGIVLERQAQVVIVGIPVSLDGHEGPRAAAARRDAGVLRRVLLEQGWSGEVLLWDERYSSKAATSSVTSKVPRRRTSGSGKRDSRQRGVHGKDLDARAATFILQGWLDWQCRPARVQSRA